MGDSPESEERRAANEQAGGAVRHREAGKERKSSSRERKSGEGLNAEHEERAGEPNGTTTQRLISARVDAERRDDAAGAGMRWRRARCRGTADLEVKKRKARREDQTAVIAYGNERRTALAGLVDTGGPEMLTSWEESSDNDQE